MKLSFKKIPHATGLSGIVNPFDYFEIKLDKKYCGLIRFDLNNSCHPNGLSKWIIRIAVEKNKLHEIIDNCSWKWIQFKKVFESSDEAKQWIVENIKTIENKYKIHCFEND